MAIYFVLTYFYSLEQIAIVIKEVLYMYISDTLKDALKDMLQESDYYFVLAEIEEAYDNGYEDGYGNGYSQGVADTL